MEQKFDITQLARIEIDLTFFKFFNDNSAAIDQLEYKGKPLYSMLHAAYVVADQIECNGIDWFISSSPNKDIFYDTIHFFAPVQEENIKQLIHSYNETSSSKTQEDILEELIFALDHVQNNAVAWVQKQPDVLLPILSTLQKVYTTFTLPIIQKSK